MTLQNKSSSHDLRGQLRTWSLACNKAAVQEEEKAHKEYLLQQKQLNFHVT
jgi:hypothetical protein